MSEVHYLNLADYLLIAEAVLKTPAEELALVIRVDLAESALAAPAAEFGRRRVLPGLRGQGGRARLPVCGRVRRAERLPVDVSTRRRA